jgi:hypothetical protein
VRAHVSPLRIAVHHQTQALGDVVTHELMGSAAKQKSTR